MNGKTIRLNETQIKLIKIILQHEMETADKKITEEKIKTAYKKELYNLIIKL